MHSDLVLDLVDMTIGQCQDKLLGHLQQLWKIIMSECHCCGTVWRRSYTDTLLSAFDPLLSSEKRTVNKCPSLLTFYFTAILKLSFSLYAPITSDECHAWFHLNAARNTEQVNITKILSTVRFEPQIRHGLQVSSPPSLPYGHNSIDMNEGMKCPSNLYLCTIYK